MADENMNTIHITEKVQEITGNYRQAGGRIKGTI